MEKIDNSAFMDCNNLLEVELSESLTSIGVHAFRSCSGLTDFLIPRSVTFIHPYAFVGVRNPNPRVYAGSYAENFCIEQELSHTVIEE